MTDPVRSIPLEDLHRALGARMGAFAGYQMPIQYPDGLKAEHVHTRTQAGLFDVSHVGQLRVRARDGRADTLHRALEAALPIDFDGWSEGVQKYSYLLDDNGGIEDDLMLVNVGDEVRIVVNAGNRDHDLALFEERCPGLEFRWIDAALVALQGPAAEAVLSRLDPAAAQMRFMQGAPLTLLGLPCYATRSGYTGEDGYEISLPLDEGARGARAVVEALLGDPAVRPVGLGARDTLRLEAGLPLHGSDISTQTTPVEAGLAFAIPKSRRTGGAKAGGFPGAARVLAQLADGPARRLRGLVSTEAVPVRAHTELLDAGDGVVGEVTSGTVSPTLGHPVMLAYIDAAALSDGDGVFRARVRDKRPAVRVTPLPFVPKRYKR
ncbi:MAG TPA: glycine cleavage system aminomethyltransferase GcvT [Quisquiliibacterium sp.]|nr:glycine cleavage system aminomethyltransferase GcvT [Quisquiliibacterium sp.]